MIERRKDQREGEIKRIYEKKTFPQPVLFADKARAETLMNTGWAVLGRDRTSVSPCFQVLPSPFTGDHPLDPVLIPSQTIIQPESATSQQYSLAIHVPMRRNGPEGERKKSRRGIVASALTPPPRPLFVLVVTARLKVTVPKGCCTLQ